MVSLHTDAQNDVLNRQLSMAVSRLDKAGTPEELKEVRNLFQRISLSNPSDWISPYYLAYTDINLFFRSNDGQLKNQFLEEAGEYLDKLKRMKGLSKDIRSEINTLQGYWYYAQMSVNPQVNGPKYSGNVISLYSEALKLNPGNPRAIILNAYFQQSLSSFTGGNYSSLSSDIERAKSLHEKEDKNTAFPHWLIEF